MAISKRNRKRRLVSTKRHRELESHFRPLSVSRRESYLSLIKRGRHNVKGKLTFSQAASAVMDVAKSCSAFVVNLNEDSEQMRGVVITRPSSAQREHFTFDKKTGLILTWDGPLRMYNMCGWRWDASNDCFNRPLPLPPRRGFATRERSLKFNWQRGMKDFVRERIVGHTALTAPYADILFKMMGHQPSWSDLTVPTLAVLKNFVRTELNKNKQDATHALARRGKRSYHGCSRDWLRAEVLNRGLQPGRKGFILTLTCMVLIHHPEPDFEPDPPP